MNWLYPLRRVIPLALLLFSLPLAGLSFVWDLHQADRRIEQQLLARAIHNGSHLAAMLEDSMEMGDWAHVQRELRTYVNMPDLSWAILLDASGNILGATDASFSGKKVEALALPPPDGMLKRVQRTLSGQTVFSPDRSVLWAVYPVRPQAGEMDRRSQFLTVALCYDTSRLHKDAWREAFVDALRNIVTLALLALLIWFYLNRVLVRRIVMLADAARSRLLGGSAQPIHVGGHDELAMLAGQIDGFSRELADRSQRMRAMFEQGFQLVGLLAPDGTMVDANKTALDLVGAQFEEIAGKPFWETRWWDGDAAQQQWLREAIARAAAGEEIHGEVRHPALDGTLRTIDFCLKPVRDEHGAVKWLIAEGHDITQLRQGEAAIRESEERFRAIFDWSNDAIFVHDLATGAIADVNRRMCEMYGYTYDEALRLNVEALSAGVAPYTQQEAQQRIGQAAAGQPQVFEWLAKGKEGKLFWVEVGMRRARIGNSDFLLVSVRDIGERKRAEANLQRLTDFYAALSLTNEAIVRSATEGDLFAQICRIAVEHGKLLGAWIGMLDETTGKVPVVASHHMDSGYLEALDISVNPALPQGQGPSAQVLRSGQFYVCNDFLHDPATQHWHGHAEKIGIRASAVFPLRRNGHVAGIINLYAGEAGFFSADLLELLKEMTLDISFALDSLARERARKQAEAQLQLAALVFESSREVIIITDANVNIVSVNKAFTEVTGYSAEEAVGRQPSLIKSGRQDDAFYHQMWLAINSLGYWHGELWNRRKNGEIYPAWVTISALRNEKGEVVNYFSVSADITEHKQAEERIQHMAYYDALTGLPNRTLLRDRAEQLLEHAGRAEEAMAFLFLDLDHFKTINDSLGHLAGDRLLQGVAERIQHSLRHVDTVGRLGGDEFLILLPEDGASGAARVSQKLLAAVAKPFEVDGHTLAVTPSIGISMFPRDGKDFDTLLRAADAAMYKAKEAGRNAYYFFAPEMNIAAFERLMLENALRNAIKNHEFVLHYQPQVEIESGRVIGVEALIRWQHPEMGMIPPGKFIPIAEDSSLIAPIGAWVLQEACRQAQAWQASGIPPLLMAVNLSTRQFSLGDVMGLVNRALDKSELAPEFLELEITESLLAQDMENTLEVLNALREKGVRISVDDFGTGYSSLAYLKRFPINKLKIDQSFVRDLISDTDDRAIAAAVVNLGHSLGLTVIAEGVETADQLETLRNLGCDEVQGFYFSRPLPAADIEPYLREKMKA